MASKQLGFDNEMQTLERLIDDIRAATAETRALNADSVKAQIQLKEMQLRNIKLIQETQLESLNRMKRAALKAEEEIYGAKYRHQEALTELAKQQHIMSKDTWQAYAKEQRQLMQAQRELESNSKRIQALLEKGYDPNSGPGRRLMKRMNWQETSERTQKYAKDLIGSMPKLGQVNNSSWLRGLRDMVIGAYTGKDGERHTLGTLRRDRANAAARVKMATENHQNAQTAWNDRLEELKNSSSSRDQNNYKYYNSYTLGLKKAQAEIANLKQNGGSAADIAAAEAKAAKFEEGLEKVMERTGLDQLNEQLEEANKEEAEAKKEQKNANAAIYQAFASTTAVLADLANSLSSLSDTIAGYKSQIDTRLNGSTMNEQLLGSYWQQIAYDFSATMLSPLIKEETLTNNLLKAVDMGIARDVEQFAMLETVKDKIATTFDTFDGTMLRLMKIQDENTTAARLGMEASLNELLNEMYETTEYLSSLASTVRSSLEEAEALMGGASAVELEYQVQKWLGSLSSVGMSSSGVSSLATAIGQLASGDISGISSGGASNLLIMAANNAGLSISDILADGLDSSETNSLMQSMVEYMAELVEEANGSLVVQQQLAKVYGLTASDLKAATNLTGEYLGKTGYVSALSSYAGSYGSMVSNLVDMANSMYGRTSVGEMLSNVWSNVQYSTASGMTNPASYLTMKAADILDAFAGGIPIMSGYVMGTGVDLNGLTVSNIMKSAALVGGFTTSLASMIGNAINGNNGFTGEGLLKLVGIDTSGASRGSSVSTSGTATIFNGNVDDITDSAETSANDEANKTVSAAKEESTEVSNSVINESIVNIYTLLQSVVDGTSSFRITPAGANGMSTWN